MSAGKADADARRGPVTVVVVIDKLPAAEQSDIFLKHSLIAVLARDEIRVG